MEERKTKKKSGLTLITPKRDFVIMHNEIFITLKKGEKAEVPDFLLQNLMTEKVIDKK